MKKYLILALILLLSVTLLGCMNQEDYFNKDEVNSLIQEQQNAISSQEIVFEEQQNQIDILNDKIPESQLLDYLTTVLFAGYFKFAEIGDTITGEVQEWGYSYIVLQSEESQEVTLTFNKVAPNGDWDINIYYNDAVFMSGPDMVFEGVTNQQTATITLQPGYTTIEFDSYYDYNYEYSITIT